MRATERWLENRKGLLRCMCLLCVLLGLLRLPFGFGYGDEGFHLATAARYVLGDRLFLDEHYATPMSFAVFTWPLMTVAPLDSVLFWRLAGYLCQISVLALIVLVLGRLKLLPPVLRALLFCGLVLYVPFNLPVLYYNNLCQLFLLGAEACLLIAVTAGTRGPALPYALAMLSALGFACAVVTYFPLLALGVLPALLLWFRRPGVRLWRLLAIWYGTLAALANGAVLWLLGTGRLAQVAANLAEKMMFPQYAMPLGERVLLKAFGHHLWTGLGLCTLGFVPVFAIVATSPRWGRLALTAAGAMMAVLLVLFTVRETGTHSPYLTLFNYGAILLAVTWLAAARFQGISLRGLWPALFALAANLAATAIVVVSASSVSADINQYNVCLWLIWPALTVLAWQLAERVEARRPGLYAREMVIGSVAAMAVFSGVHLWRWSYEDLPPHQLRAMFHHGKLRGIVSTREKVETAGKLLDLIQGHAKRGEFVLAYNGFPGVSYLLDLRPALYSTLVGDGQPPEPLLSRWLEDAKQRWRQPQTIIVKGRIGQGSSLGMWLDRDYYAIGRVANFSVYRERAAASP